MCNNRLNFRSVFKWKRVFDVICYIFQKQVSSAERIKKMEECIALVEELKIYRDQLINQKDALKPIRQNEQIEENILELAIAYEFQIKLMSFELTNYE